MCRCWRTIYKTSFAYRCRWLSKGNYLRRFVNLFNTIVVFLRTEGHSDLTNKIEAQKKNIHYLSWIFRKLNEVSLLLQGKMITLIDCKRVMRAFVEKLDLFQVNLKLRQFHNMPELADIDLCENDIVVYCVRFDDLFNFAIIPRMIDPFDCDLHSAHENIQEEVIEMKCNDELQIKFKRETLSEFWQSKTIKSYIQICGHKWRKFFCVSRHYVSSKLDLVLLITFCRRKETDLTLFHMEIFVSV